jgi:transposase-like protein
LRGSVASALSYRDLEELVAERGVEVDPVTAERGVEVDHVTMYRWVQRLQNLGRGHYELATDARRPQLRLSTAFTELALAI